MRILVTDKRFSAGTRLYSPVNAPPFLQVLPRLLSKATAIESAVLERRFHLAGPMDYSSRKLVNFVVRLRYGL
jgi:hypothetical protein